jgi:hypothetical protein
MGYESFVGFTEPDSVVIRLHQQQQPAAPAEDDCGRSGEFGDDGGLPGRYQAALQLI